MSEPADELDAYLASKMKDPEFAAAYKQAEQSPSWFTRAWWWAWGWLHWPLDVRQFKREGWTRTGWAQWESPACIHGDRSIDVMTTTGRHPRKHTR